MMQDKTIRILAAMLCDRISDDGERDDLEMLADLVEDVRQQNRPELLASIEAVYAEAEIAVEDAEEDARQEAESARWQ